LHKVKLNDLCNDVKLVYAFLLSSKSHDSSNFIFKALHYLLIISISILFNAYVTSIIFSDQHLKVKRKNI